MTRPTLARAWDEIYIAEGSDWFWWYGDDHSQRPRQPLRPPVPQAPAQRLHAARLAIPPGILFTPISQAGCHRPIHDQPTSFLNVKIDGRATYFEWIDAARYVCGNERGTMTLVTKGLLECGLVRLRRRAIADPRRYRGRAGRGAVWPRSIGCGSGFVDPADREIVVDAAGGPPARGLPQPCGRHRRERDDRRGGHRHRSSSSPSRSPGSSCQAGRHDPVLRRAAQAATPASTVPPARGSSSSPSPRADFERIMWQV